MAHGSHWWVGCLGIGAVVYLPLLYCAIDWIRSR